MIGKIKYNASTLTITNEIMAIDVNFNIKTYLTSLGLNTIIIEPIQAITLSDEAIPEYLYRKN